MKETLDRLYVECRLLSGGFEHKPSFAEMVAFGRSALPLLLSELAQDDEATNPWVVMSLLYAIVGDASPKLENLEDRGKFEPVRAMWLAWGEKTLT